LPDWQDDIRRCHEEHGMPGLRLHPNYHGYQLDDARLDALWSEAADRSLLVQVAAAMEDERTQHPLVRVPTVRLDPLAAILKARPKLRVVILNVNPRPGSEPWKSLFASGRAWVDTAMLEGIAAVEKFVSGFGAGRLVVGTHAPFYSLHGPALKLQESIISDRDRRAITDDNAAIARAVT
jgi:predicted TIM-barrel fold metal-dependent hydrolase